MKTEILENDVKLLYVKANSFPEDVMSAHQQIHSIVPLEPPRTSYGLSRPEYGKIEYKAAVEELETGEAERLNCDSITVKKGRYVSAVINDFMKDIQSIGNTFRELLSHPEIDPEGYCVEVYLNDKDVKCMVRLAE